MGSAYAGLALGLSVLQLPAPTRAQSLVAGSWSGAVTDPYGHSRPVLYSVAGPRDSLSITLSEPPGARPVAFADVHLLADTLTFKWAGGAQGSRVSCKLVRQTDGVYEGSCADSQGREGRMRMTPPETTQPPTRPLFNGRDLTGWHADVPAADTNVRLRSPFLVRNGMLVSLGEPRGHLITDSSYHDYRLDVEYRFAAAPGNAGVLVHASTPRALYGMFPRSIEVQMEHGNAGDFWCIVEDIRVPDMEKRRGPPAQWGTTEGKRRRILNLTDDSEKPVGEWNTMVIEAVGRAIRVWVNGDLVNDGSDATADRGQIALQSEGSEVEFRKLSLTPISKLTTHADH